MNSYYEGTVRAQNQNLHASECTKHKRRTQYCCLRERRCSLRLLQSTASTNNEPTITARHYTLTDNTYNTPIRDVLGPQPSPEYDVVVVEARVVEV